MPATIYRDAREAWEAFKVLGGLDLGDRDSDLEQAILERLPRSAAGQLDEALRTASTDALVHALFDAATPFVEMFRAILDFFKVASVVQGREQWEIRIDEDHLDLRDFEKFLSAVSEVPGALDVPDLRDAYLSRVREILLQARTADIYPATEARDPDLEPWLAAYERGEFPTLPSAVTAADLPPGLDDVRSMLSARLSMVREAYGDRTTMMRDRSSRGWSMPRYDPFHPHSAAQGETDFWARSTLELLYDAHRSPPLLRTDIDRALQAEFAGPRRSVEHQVSVDQLERILSLPVWRRRHELYAVWIATEIVGALPDHEVVLNQEDGRIVFAFRETVVARVITARPERRVIAERRSPLADPIGASRRSAVQPDYGIWSDAAGVESCHLIVEVKHYKRARRRAFEAVVEDYARAHPTAQVVLVNHGPIGALSIRPDIERRSHSIGELTVRNTGARTRFADFVRAAVGEPFRRPAPSAAGTSALLIDISGSMLSALRPEIVRQAATLAAEEGIVEATLVDVAVVGVMRLDALVTRLPTLRGGATHLAPAAAELLNGHSRMLVLTDAEGLEQLQAAFSVSVEAQWGEVSFAVVSRSKSRAADAGGGPAAIT